MNCPKCNEEMELKAASDPFAAFIGGNCLTIFQCPSCKNIEIDPPQSVTFPSKKAAGRDE